MKQIYKLRISKQSSPKFLNWYYVKQEYKCYTFTPSVKLSQKTSEIQWRTFRGNIMQKHRSREIMAVTHAPTPVVANITKLIP